MKAHPRHARSALVVAAVVLAAVHAAPTGTLAADGAGRIPRREAIAIREAWRIAEAIGEEIWPGFAAVPFPVVLVTEETELLVGWTGPPPAGFDPPFEHPLLGPVAQRPRVFSPALSAAFPAFGPPAVVVIGTLNGTGRSPGEWTLTLLHEHFHQLQYAAPDYHRDVEALDLSGGDTSGMWMLDYPFPYEDEAVGRRFGGLVAALRRALSGEAAGTPVWTALDDLVAGLAPADARYLGFQLWQEGVARYVELRAAELLAHGDLSPDGDFAALPGFDGWEAEAARVRELVGDELETVDLAEWGRSSFYPVGAALGMLLDRDAPDWRQRYLERRFRLDGFAAPAVEVTYLANEGFLLAAGDDKVLIDSLFPGLDGYPRVPAELRARLDRGLAPFDGVDAVLATHIHGDHFGAAEVARHLASSQAVFVSTPDAVRLLRREAGAPLDPVARYPEEGERERLTAGGLAVTVFNLHHGRSRPEIQNLGFLVEIGGLKILHVGDTEVTARDLGPYDLASERIDVALLPGWLLAEPSWRPVVAEIDARHLVVMHLAAPDAPPSWFGSARSLEGRIASIREHFPEAWIPTEPLATRGYRPAP